MCKQRSSSLDILYCWYITRVKYHWWWEKKKNNTLIWKLQTKLMKFFLVQLHNNYFKCLMQHYVDFCWTITLLKFCWEPVMEWRKHILCDIFLFPLLLLTMIVFYWFIHNFMISNTSICFFWFWYVIFPFTLFSLTWALLIFTDCFIHNFMINNIGICFLLILVRHTIFINHSQNDGKIRYINELCLFNEIISKWAQLFFHL